MANERSYIIKPSCMHEIHALPPKAMAMIMEKVQWLASDPIPDGKLKKKVQSLEGVYRLRVGDYRLFYSFEEAWVCLLGVRLRRDAYSEAIAAQLPADLPAPESLATVADDAFDAAEEEVAATLTAQAGRALPRAITPEWLAQLKVPDEYHAALCACRDEDALLAAPVPPDILDRVIDNLWPRPLADVVQQPDYVVAAPADLQRYHDGDLLGFLLRLDPEQARLADWRLKGPAIIKGGPGTGKSTIALYRVKALLDRAAAEGRPAPRLLFTTFTNALTRVSEQLLEQLLGDRAGLVTVSTADRLARTIASHVEPVPEPADSQTLTNTLNDLRTRFEPPGRNRFDREVRRAALAALRTDFLLSEFEWVIEGRNLTTLEEYQAADRSGRGQALRPGLREAVWYLYQDFAAEVQRKGLITFGQVRNRALQALRSGQYRERFDGVLIDEAQDLTPAALSMLSELCREPEGLYLTADASQSLYARGFTWAQVHERLRFRGRTALLRRNYRTSREIARAAAAFLRQTGAGDPDCLSQDCVHSGPLPVLHAVGSEDEQWGAAAEYIRAASRRLRLPPRAAAVLVPTRALGEQAAQALSRAGLPARFMKGSDLDLSAPEVKVLTLHSAKGLEFPIVVLLGVREGQMPRLAKELAPEEIEAETQAYRRLFFVGMTRAMRGLCLCYPGSRPSPFIAELDPALWDSTWEANA